jgi:hypothetical protein
VPVIEETDQVASTSDSPRQTKTEKPVNEIVKSAAQAKEGEEAARSSDDNRTAWIAAGVGVGIGSAALVAALLYANKSRGNKNKKD